MFGAETDRKYYPDPISWLSVVIAIRAVAIAVRCSIIKVAINKIKSDIESLRQRA